jgi:hypothetical protein
VAAASELRDGRIRSNEIGGVNIRQNGQRLHTSETKPRLKGMVLVFQIQWVIHDC